MKTTGNTIFITGGGTGIGRGLAEEFHRLGNQVIIAGRRLEKLKAVLDANPGMAAVELDIRDVASIQAVAAQLVSDYPALNVLINNAGIMLLDDIAHPDEAGLLAETVMTNLGGPIRMTAALMGHMKSAPNAVIINVSSILAFVPLAATAIYSATKAALHSYTLSLRYRLRADGIQVIELSPPWVRTDLLNSSKEERAMPLDAFIAETMELLGTDADEILVGQAPQMRSNPGPNEHAWVTGFNDLMTSGAPLG